MDFETYQKLSRRTMNQGDDQILNAALGLAGEVGETVELIKKSRFHGKPYNREQMISEMGDVLYYLAFMAECVGVSLDTVAYSNVQKLEARYPQGFVPGGGVRDGQ